MRKVFKPNMVAKFFYWIEERERVRIQKQLKQAPWTRDKILQRYRFCNVRRMDDKVSRWLFRHWYPLPTSGETVKTYLTAACLARLINWPDTLAYVSRGKRFNGRTDLAEIKYSLYDWKAKGNKVFTGAYIINGGNKGDKINHVMSIISAVSKKPMHKIVYPTSFENSVNALARNPGFGRFLAGQIVADLCHTPAIEAKDQMSYAPMGPGSKRGMNRLLGADIKSPIDEYTFSALLRHLITIGKLEYQELEIVESMDAMDFQNCLCEFDKWIRTFNGEGRPRSNYPGRLTVTRANY